jgi:hypothetical protein
MTKRVLIIRTELSLVLQNHGPPLAQPRLGPVPSLKSRRHGQRRRGLTLPLPPPSSIFFCSIVLYHFRVNSMSFLCLFFIV